MRGYQNEQDQLFFTIDVESRIRPDHPLRPFKKRVDAILKAMTDRFSAAYSRMGRPGVPPEQLLKALLIMAVYSIRSERQLVERIDTDLLFRWFLDMTPEDPVFDATAFTHNRERLEEHGLTAAFFDAVLSEAITEQLCSDDHFSVDGTTLFLKRGLNPWPQRRTFSPSSPRKMVRTPTQATTRSATAQTVTKGLSLTATRSRLSLLCFKRGQQRSNKTHRSRTDPEARLHRKGPLRNRQG